MGVPPGCDARSPCDANDLWGVSDPVEIEEKVARGEGIRSEEVADAVGFMLTRPRHVTIRDLVILPSNQPI